LHALFESRDLPFIAGLQRPARQAREGVPAQTDAAHGDGSVTGRVADSTLRDGRFLRHRPVGETREQRPDLFDYMIRGYLEGPVSAATRLTSEELFLPLDYDRDMLHGTAHISGTVVDGHQFGYSVLRSRLEECHDEFA
jgi:hypothetical protein